MTFKSGATRMQAHELPRPRTIHESLRAIETHMKAKEAKKNWQPKKDPNDFYRRNGSAFAAQESAAEARRRQGERDV